MKKRIALIIMLVVGIISVFNLLPPPVQAQGGTSGTYYVLKRQFTYAEFYKTKNIHDLLRRSRKEKKVFATALKRSRWGRTSQGEYIIMAQWEPCFTAPTAITERAEIVTIDVIVKTNYWGWEEIQYPVGVSNPYGGKYGFGFTQYISPGRYTVVDHPTLKTHHVNGRTRIRLLNGTFSWIEDDFVNP